MPTGWISGPKVQLANFDQRQVHRGALVLPFATGAQQITRQGDIATGRKVHGLKIALFPGHEPADGLLFNTGNIATVQWQCQNQNFGPGFQVHYLEYSASPHDHTRPNAVGGRNHLRGRNRQAVVRPLELNGGARYEAHHDGQLSPP